MQTIHFKYNSYQLQIIITPSSKLEFLVPSLIAALGENSGKLGRKLMNGIAKQYKQRRLILSTTLNKPFRQLTIEKDVLLDYCRHNVHIKEFAALASFLSNVEIPQIQDITTPNNPALQGSNSLVEELKQSIDKSPDNDWYYFLDAFKVVDSKLETNALKFKEQLWDAIPDQNKKEEPQSEEFHYHRHLINRGGLDDLVTTLESYRELVYSDELPQSCSWGLLNGQMYYTAKSIVSKMAEYFQQEINEKYVGEYLKLVSDGNKTKQTINLMNSKRYNGWLLAANGIKELTIHFAAQKLQSLVWENHLNTVVVDIPTDCDDFTKIPVEVVFELIDNLKGHPIDFDAAWKWAGYSKKENAKRVLNSGFGKGSDFYSIISTIRKRGNLEEKIYLTIECFKHFCIMAQTKKGKECRQYLLDCEKKYREMRSISTTSTTNYTYEQFIDKKIPIPALTPALNNQEFYSRFAYETIAQYLTGRKSSFEEQWQEFVVNPSSLKTAIAWDTKVMKEASRWGFTSQDMQTIHHNTLTNTALKKCIKQGTISIENAQSIEVLLREALHIVEPPTIVPKRPRLIQPASGVNTTPGDKAKELESSEIIELLARKCVILKSRGDTWYKWDDLIKAINQDVDRMDLEIQHRIWQKLDKSCKRGYRKDLFVNKQGIAQTMLMYSGFVYPNSKIEAIPEVAEIFFNSKKILDILDKRKLCCLNQAIREIDFDGIANNAYISDWVTIDESNKFYDEKTDFGTKYQEVHITKFGFVQLIQSYIKNKEKIDSSEVKSLERQFALLDIW